MKKITFDKGSYQDKFLVLLKSIAYNKRESELFTDFITMASAALYTWKKDEKVEKEYLARAKLYNREQLDKFTKLLAYISLAFDEEEKDFLGGIYQCLNMGSNRLSQFFTPQDISDSLVQLTLQPGIKPGKVTTILDPCCGSGVMLISAANEVKRQDEKNIEHVLLIGQDIDSLCAHITFIQLSLLGVPAIVKCGDSLIDEVIWHRETLWYHTYKIGEKLRKEKEGDKAYKCNKLELFPA